jgi:hypothetical protein
MGFEAEPRSRALAAKSSVRGKRTTRLKKVVD